MRLQRNFHRQSSCPNLSNILLHRRAQPRALQPQQWKPHVTMLSAPAVSSNRNTVPFPSSAAFQFSATTPSIHLQKTHRARFQWPFRVAHFVLIHHFIGLERSHRRASQLRQILRGKRRSAGHHVTKRRFASLVRSIIRVPIIVEHVGKNVARLGVMFAPYAPVDVAERHQRHVDRHDRHIQSAPEAFAQCPTVNHSSPAPFTRSLLGSTQPFCISY